MDFTEKSDLVGAALRTAPGAVVYGITLNELVGVATFVFLILQILYLVRKWWREESSVGRKMKRKVHEAQSDE